jgi:DNA repair protein RecN (Recombination protein N)
MLAFLRVKNFAIIDELEIEFKEGLNVITGETGAGKSIIINALATLMSSKTPSDVVKDRSQPSEVTGHYCHEYNQYVLRRTMSPQGRSRAYVN